jgi:hypothetical protein
MALRSQDIALFEPPTRASAIRQRVPAPDEELVTLVGKDDEEETETSEKPSRVAGDDVLEEWLQNVSLTGGDDARPTSPGFAYFMTAFVPSLVASFLVTGILLSVIDAYFLLLAAFVEAGITGRLLYAAIETWAMPASGKRREMDHMVLSMLFVLTFLYFTAFWAALSTLGALALAFFNISASSSALAIVELIAVALMLITLTAHPAIGLISHYEEAVSGTNTGIGGAVAAQHIATSAAML